MFASGTSSMTGPREKTPLLLLLLLLTSLTGTVLCQDDDAEGEEPETGPQDGEDPEPGDDGNLVTSEPTPIEATSASDPSSTVEDLEKITDGVSGSGDESTGDTLGTADPEQDEEDLSIIIILIPVVLVVVIIGMIVCAIFISRRWKNKERNQELRKEDPYLDGSSTEKVPMPMFEEDVPSVLELEMEELGQWMKKDDEAATGSNHA